MKRCRPRRNRSWEASVCVTTTSDSGDQGDATSDPDLTKPDDAPSPRKRLWVDENCYALGPEPSTAWKMMELISPKFPRMSTKLPVRLNDEIALRANHRSSFLVFVGSEMMRSSSSNAANTLQRAGQEWRQRAKKRREEEKKRRREEEKKRRREEEKKRRREEEKKRRREEEKKRRREEEKKRREG
ncbi:uncharacterized protein N7496_003751 [Penicillium cataractarum]|uniref:Uncharacterized protein n=1 Tax=Penicillium cataractarum TaxID=2100454 RepID=A0A9W9VGH7_9EURO|nr:uncharacterized protein N7496_003751 [Penicillium cataractarum]KAJ5381323.1 hypothetical protein N7496_003751 [Penicillium cataractarum]